MKKRTKIREVLRRLVKLPLDDDGDNQVFKRRFLNKNYHISGSWMNFSSEFCIDLSPGGRDMFGVSNEEYCTSEESNMVNKREYLIK